MANALNPKQEEFIAQYLIDLNGTQAAIRAGYSERSAKEQASRLLTNDNITNAIAKAQAKRSERTEVTQDYVLTSIVDAMERCKQAEAVVTRDGDPVMVETPNGEMSPAYTFNASGVFKGAELLGKHLGMFTDRVQVDSDLTIKVIDNYAPDDPE